MSVLIVHNYYKERGGEDNVFENEYKILKSAGFNVSKLDIHNNQIISLKDKLLLAIKLFYNSNFIKKLKKIINKKKIKIVIIHNYFPLISIFSYFYLKSKGIKIYQVIHNYRFLCSKGIFFRDGKICNICNKNKLFGFFFKCYKNSYLFSFALYLFQILTINNKYWIKNIDGFIFLSEFQKDIFNNTKIPENKKLLKHNFINQTKIELNQRNKFYLFIGRISEEKGILRLIDLWPSQNNLKLIICGEGPLKNDLNIKIKKRKNIENLGFKKSIEILTLKKNATCIIFSSLWYEVFPLSIIECIYNGLPILIANNPNIRRIYPELNNNFYFDINNKKAFLKKLENISNIQKKELNNTYKKIINRYSEKNLIKFYKEKIIDQ